MAHFDKRMDSKLLSILLDVDSDGAEKVLKALLELSFVKKFIGSKPIKCTLHDEMDELINKHAWNSLDIRGEERERLTQKVLNLYYLPRINEFVQRRIEDLGQQNRDLLNLKTQTTLLRNLQLESCIIF